MRQKLGNLKISHKLTLGFLILIVFPLFLLWFYNFRSFTEQSNQQLIQSGKYILDSIEQDVNEKLDSVETIIQSLATNGNLIFFLSSSFSGSSSFEEYTQTILPLLQGAQNMVSPYIDRLMLLTENTSIPPGFNLVYSASDFDSASLDAFLASGDTEAWFFEPSGLSRNSLESYLAQKFIYIKTVTSPFGKKVGYVAVQVSAGALFSELLFAENSNTALFLLDGNNLPTMSNIFLGDDFTFPFQSSAGPYRDKSTIYLSSDLSRLSMKFGVALSENTSSVLFQNSFLTVLIVGLLSSTFLFVFYELIHSITTRLQAYAKDMETIAQSGFRSQLKVDRPDEIGEIGQLFNATLQKVRSLMQENIQKETAYKDVQLQALLLQINPHFIYNTLDLFVGKLMLSHQYEIADYLCDFAQMIRYNTLTTRMFISLGEEVEYTKNYVGLQRCRYGDAVSLKLTVPPALNEIPVLRFLLQPLVENSFEHGFTAKGPDAPRHVAITARTCRGWLVLRVKDNGCGMSPQEVDALNERFRAPYRANALEYEKRRGGIGLDNINDRIHLFYTNSGMIRLKSRKGFYTSVFIIVKI